MLSARFRPAILVVVLALLQSGCVAWTQSAPNVKGRLLDSRGHPVAGASVVQESYIPLAHTRSNNDGVFTFPGEREWSFFLPVGPIDKMNRSQLNISARGQQYTVLLASGLSGPYGSVPSEVGVVCVLPDVQQQPKFAGADVDICERIAQEKVEGYTPHK